MTPKFLFVYGWFLKNAKKGKIIKRIIFSCLNTIKTKYEKKNTKENMRKMLKHFSPYFS